MNRRSALLAAAGVVISLVVAVAAITAGIVGPDSAAANVAARDRKPHVRTITRTVTVHKPGGTVTVTGSSSSDGDADDRVSDGREDGDRDDAVTDDDADDAYGGDDSYGQEDQHEDEYEDGYEDDVTAEPVG